MGANIGTSVTNTIVSAGHASDRDQFRRAFAGATVHDVFNWLSVVILLPIEAASGYLYHLSGAVTDSLGLKKGEREKVELLEKITKPFTNIVIQIDKKLIQKIAEGEDIGQYGGFNKKYTFTKLNLKEQCHLVRIFSAHNNKISEIVRCLKYSLVVLYGTKLCIFLHRICESASRIRHNGLENLKNYCRSFSSSRAQKRCAPGDIAPLLL
jgi:hypothetical protein